MNANNLVRHASSISRDAREAANGHRAAVVWFTGLPSSGKSTTAHEVENRLFHSGQQVYVLDGDNVRHGLSSDLGFSAADRVEHLRRVAELAKLLYGSGLILLCAFVSPMRQSRAMVRELIPAGSFFEVFCRCPRDTCERRDPKGHYARAKAGTLADYTGVSTPYEEPERAELVLDTDANSPAGCAEQVIALLEEHGVVGRSPVKPPRAGARSTA